jgi:hypothetical protein
MNTIYSSYNKRILLYPQSVLVDIKYKQNEVHGYEPRSIFQI